MPIALSPAESTRARRARDPYQQTARARDQQSGAVEERAQQVHTENLRHARQLDRRYHPQASPYQPAGHDHPSTGPVEQVVLDHDRVRGLVIRLVIGGYGEWSMDVEWLLEEAARTAARRDWSRMGLPGEQVAYVASSSLAVRGSGRWSTGECARAWGWLSECGCDAGQCRLLMGIVLRSGGVCVRVNVRFVCGVRVVTRVLLFYVLWLCA